MGNSVISKSIHTHVVFPQGVDKIEVSLEVFVLIYNTNRGSTWVR